MSKPTTPPDTTEEGYYVDLIADDAEQLPAMVQTHLRHLLLACELGDLVVARCARRIDNTYAYIICASVVDANNKRRLLPICELEDTNILLARYRPPAAAKNAFVNPAHTGEYEVRTLTNPDETALAEVFNNGDSVH